MATQTQTQTASLNLKPAMASSVWRGDKAGNVVFKGYPEFNGDKNAERQWVKEHLAASLQYWGKMGFGEGIAGHITVKDPILTDHFWMNPFGIHFSCVRVSDLVLVSPDGYVTEHGAQLPINMAGFNIHSAIHAARPDVKSAAHCHTIYGKAWSVFGRKIDMLTQDSCFFYNNHAVYENFGGIVLAKEEGEEIAKALGPKNRVCILQNHGLLALGDTADEATMYFSAMDRLCQVQLLVEAAEANGLKKTVIGDQEAEYTAKAIQNPISLYLSFQGEFQLIKQERGQFFLQ